VASDVDGTRSVGDAAVQRKSVDGPVDDGPEVGPSNVGGDHVEGSRDGSVRGRVGEDE